MALDSCVLACVGVVSDGTQCSTGAYLLLRSNQVAWWRWGPAASAGRRRALRVVYLAKKQLTTLLPLAPLRVVFDALAALPVIQLLSDVARCKQASVVECM